MHSYKQLVLVLLGPLLDEGLEAVGVPLAVPKGDADLLGHALVCSQDRQRLTHLVLRLAQSHVVRVNLQPSHLDLNRYRS